MILHEVVLYAVTVYTAIQVEFEKTKVTPRENAGSVEMVLIANQTHTESFGVRVLYFTGTASKNIVQCDHACTKNYM